MVVKLSKYRLMMYKRCPRQYKYVCLDGVQPEVMPGQNVGIDFHEQADRFFDVVDVEVLKGLKSYHDVFDYMMQFSDFTTFVEFESRRWWRYYYRMPEKYKPVERELTLKVYEEIGGVQVRLVGIVDRVDLFEDKLLLLEYKRKAPKTIKTEMAYYAWLWGKVYDRKVDKVGVFEYDVDEDWQFSVWNVHTNSLKAVKRAISEMLNDDEFEPKTNSCAFCPVLWYCFREW